jgi:hypothetical protein
MVVAQYIFAVLTWLKRKIEVMMEKGFILFALFLSFQCATPAIADGSINAYGKGMGQIAIVLSLLYLGGVLFLPFLIK